MATQTLTLPDSRALAYGVYGSTSPSSPTVFYFHGFPGSHHEASSFSAVAATRGIRIVAPTRPGMGASTLRPSRTLLDWPADVLALADHLSLARFAILGVSGGAPYTLACWKVIPRGRLVGCALVSGLYPTELGLSGMMLEGRALLWIAPWLTGLVAVGMDRALGKMAREEDPEVFAKAMDESFRKNRGRGEADLAAWAKNEGGIKDALIHSTREAVKPEGGAGVAWDARLLGSRWGFELGELEIEKGKKTMVMWHGDRDANVPIAMAHKAVALMEGAELRIGVGEGHASTVVHSAEDVMLTLEEMLKGA